MSEDMVIDVGMDALMVALKVALPLLAAGLIVGLLVSIFQAITQIQEPTLVFIPKILAMVAVGVVAGPWMLDQVLTWTEQLYAGIPGMASP